MIHSADVCFLVLVCVGCARAQLKTALHFLLEIASYFVYSLFLFNNKQSESILLSSASKNMSTSSSVNDRNLSLDNLTYCSLNLKNDLWLK